LERLEDRLLLSHADGSPVLDDNGFLLVELGDGNDVLLYEHLDAETSRLTINGDSHDYFRGAVLAIEVAAGGGADRIEIAGDVDVWATLDGQDGDDTLIGGAGPDELIAGDGTDSLLAAAGDDRLIVKPTDTFDSGDGADALIVQVGGTSGPDTIQIQVVDDLTSRLTINGVSIDYDAGELAEVEVSAGDGADLVEVAADLAIVATLVGGEGDDTLVAGAMSDSIDAGPGSDSVVAGDGYDTVVGGDGFDTIDAGAGDDVVDGGAGDDSIAGGDGANTLVGGWGGDTITAGDWSDAIEGGLAGGTVDDPSDGNDSIVAGAGDDTIFGSGGSDTIDAAAGFDTIDCGAGSDSVLGGEDADTIACGAGDDTIEAGDGDDVLNAGAGSNSVDGGNGFDILSLAGTDEADSILIDDAVGTITVALAAATDSLRNIEHVEFVGVGNRLDYHITIANNGPLPVSNPEIILDLPSGVTPIDSSCVLETSVYVCPLGPIVSGGTINPTISVQVGLNAPGTITIRPLVTTGTPGDSVEGNNFLENTNDVTRTDLKIAKLASPASPVPVASGAELKRRPRCRGASQ
jgi:uncharacterized repeat protein (TIGR01451 family)